MLPRSFRGRRMRGGFSNYIGISFDRPRIEANKLFATNAYVKAPDLGMAINPELLGEPTAGAVLDDFTSDLERVPAGNVHSFLSRILSLEPELLGDGLVCRFV